jgi:hypothetical protein
MQVSRIDLPRVPNKYLSIAIQTGYHSVPPNPELQDIRRGQPMQMTKLWAVVDIKIITDNPAPCKPTSLCASLSVSQYRGLKKSAGPGMLSVISKPERDIPISTDKFSTEPQGAWNTSSY